jgi:uncharacterized protein YndB with AHSA1/START domain
LSASKPAIDSGSPSPEREIVVSRFLDAPRELVWNAGTDPAQLVLWWGPKGFSTTIHEMDLKPGGVWRHTKHGPDGTNYPNKSTFQIVVKQERIVNSHAGGRESGSGTNFVATCSFEDQGHKTRLSLHKLFELAQELDRVIKEFGASEGSKQTPGRLPEHLAATPIVIERTLNVPADVVWNAFTDPSRIKQWYIPTLEFFKPEVGFETQFSVYYQEKDFHHLLKVTEAIPGRKISYTWNYSNFAGNSLVTFELFALGKQTRLKLIHQGLESFLPGSNPDLAKSNFSAGWTAIASQLEDFLQNGAKLPAQELVLTPIFEAPAARVFKVWTDPMQLKQWWGPWGYTDPVCELYLPVEGTIRY